MKRRESFLYVKKMKMYFLSTIRLLCVSLHHRSTILEIMHRTQAALLYPPQWKDEIFSFKSKRKYTWNTHHCIEADTEERSVHNLQNGARYFYFLCVQKVFSSHKSPGFHLKLCSEDEQSFYGVGTTCG